MTSHAAWYVVRATGLVAFVLLTISVVLGLLLSTRLLRRRPPAPWLLDVHRMASGLSVAFVGLHMLALLADSWLDFDWVDLLVPFAADWHPWAMAAGVIAFWLLVAVEVTSLARRRISQRVWRTTHFASYVLFWLAALHMAVGTDSTNTAWRTVSVASIGLVMFLTLVRVPDIFNAASRRGAGISTSSAPGGSAARPLLPESPPREPSLSAPMHSPSRP